MIGYVTLGANDIAKSAKFYDALLGEMGAKRVMEADTFVAWAVDPSKPAISIIKPHNGDAASVGNGVMVAIPCEKPETVDKLYKKAIELGAVDEGPAGPRGDSFYAGYFRDLDGNKLNFYCMT
ncbi:MAG: VOC family protein [Pseudomonadota bacterium]